MAAEAARVTAALAELAVQHRDAAMLSRTHGQPATPTTMGKEIGVFAWRLERVIRQLDAGSTSRSSPRDRHLVGARRREPDVDWPSLTREFIESLGLGFNAVTTQIESHDWQVELYDRARHAGGILHNLATDVWTYISLGYFTQIPVAGPPARRRCPQDQPHPVRERRGQPRDRRRAVLDPGIHPRHEPPAARPDRLHDAAQHRRRLRPLPARSRQPAARPDRDLARRGRAARRPRRELGKCSPKRSRPSCAPRSPPVARRSPIPTPC